MITKQTRIASGALRWLVIPALLLMPPTLADAHPQVGAIGGFVSGFLHPLTGLDHIAAMVGVGLWGAYLGAPAIWMLPVIFPMVMAFGGALGVLGIPMPGVELGIAFSGILLGAMVLFKARPPLWIAGVIVGTFAIFHGHAHGAELPHAANAITYAVGFVIATGLLHLCGITLGLLVRWPWGQVVIRTGGALITCVGFGFLFGFLQ